MVAVRHSFQQNGVKNQDQGSGRPLRVWLAAYLDGLQPGSCIYTSESTLRSPIHAIRHAINTIGRRAMPEAASLPYRLLRLDMKLEDGRYQRAT